MKDALRRAVASRIERGAWQAEWSLTMADWWARAARATRNVSMPKGARVVGVGGSTLGGSHKTPLVLALARALAESGCSVAVAGHGYRGALEAPRRVSPRDEVAVVGDDALWLARDLEDVGVPVIAGRRRAERLACAASQASVVLADGLLQASPERVALSLLVVDAAFAWGSARCPPAGDLRASKGALLAAADLVVAVSTDSKRDAVALAALAADAANAGKSVVTVESTLVATEAKSGRGVALGALAGRRAGLVLAVARPSRVTMALAAHGIEPHATELFADHAVPRPPRRAVASSVEVWLTTPKCATKLAAEYGGAPLVVLRQCFRFPPGFVERIGALGCQGFSATT